MASVGCKLPNGFVMEHDDKKVTLNGANHGDARFGYGVTNDVDADWFKAAVEGPYKEFPPVVQGSIFLVADGKRAEDAAKERENDKTVTTGMEPIDPNAPGEGVEPTDEQKKENEKAPAARRAKA